MPIRNLPIKTGHLFLGLAAIMFIVTVSIFSGGKHEAPAKKVAKIPTQEVVVPLTPISEGQTISMNDVTAVKWPSEFLPHGATFTNASDVVGRVAKQNLFPGEPIFNEKVSGSDTNGGLPAIIPNGLRAVSVAVTEVKGVAGFVKPGDHVDVLSTFEVNQTNKDDNGGSDKMHETKTVLQNVLVLASAQTMVNDAKYDINTPDGVTRGDAEVKTEDDSKDSKKDKAKKAKSDSDLEKEAKERQKEKKEAEKAARLVSSVTLALTPEQTEALALAEETGEIRLALRPETDSSIAKLSGIDSNKLLGKDQQRARPVMPIAAHVPPPPQIPMAPPPMMGAQVEFIQGTDKTMYNFNN